MLCFQKRPLNMKRAPDQSVLSLPAPSWDNCLGHLPNPANNFETKDARSSCLTCFKTERIRPGVSSRTKVTHSKAAAAAAAADMFVSRTWKGRSIADFMDVYLLSRNLSPSQLLGGDLCRTEFMVHLFGTIKACGPPVSCGGFCVLSGRLCLSGMAGSMLVAHQCFNWQYFHIIVLKTQCL